MPRDPNTSRTVSAMLSPIQSRFVWVAEAVSPRFTKGRTAAVSADTIEARKSRAVTTIQILWSAVTAFQAHTAHCSLQSHDPARAVSPRRIGLTQVLASVVKDQLRLGAAQPDFLNLVLAVIGIAHHGIRVLLIAVLNLARGTHQGITSLDDGLIAIQFNLVFTRFYFRTANHGRLKERHSISRRGASHCKGEHSERKHQ